jgi:hypothetical protein
LDLSLELLRLLLLVCGNRSRLNLLLLLVDVVLVVVVVVLHGTWGRMLLVVRMGVERRCLWLREIEQAQLLWMVKVLLLLVGMLVLRKEGARCRVVLVLLRN